VGLSFSVGAISQAHGRVAGALRAPVAETAASLCTADALRMDETHYPRECIANWVWAAVQSRLAVFATNPSRPRCVILDFIGEKCTAAVTSDRYAGYAFFDAGSRQVCWTHLLREFNPIGQRRGLASATSNSPKAQCLTGSSDARGQRWKAEPSRTSAAAPPTPAPTSSSSGRRCGPIRRKPPWCRPTAPPSRRCAAWCSSERSQGLRDHRVVTNSWREATRGTRAACARV
jgi:hypothetical protein